MKKTITFTLILTLFSFVSLAQESKLDESMRYSYLGDFNSVSSSQESVAGKVFDDIDVIIKYTVLENVDGGRIFKDVSVYSTDICRKCELDVEFSEKQFHEDDILESQSSIFLTFTLMREGKNQVKVTDETVAKLTSDGKFSIRKNKS